MCEMRRRVTWTLLTLVPLIASGCLEDADRPIGEGPIRVGTGGWARAVELHAAHILITFDGSPLQPPDVKRTKEEALAKARELASLAKVEGADFAELARKHSACTSAERGGDLGTFLPVDKSKEFSQAVLALAMGEISDPVETEMGYHIIKRQPPASVRKVGVKHVLVRYWGAKRAPLHIARTRSEARERISECQQRLEQGESFSDLVREYSECPSRHKDGDLGVVNVADMDEEFGKAALEREIGNTSRIVETPYGFHIVLRYE
ncbi:MAG: hypothetical protein FJ276_09155 [Planctomycetes bacterium]|nr:hypothetical protein [Planctomycetota bacterium]